MSSFIFIGGDRRMLYAAERLGKAHLYGFRQLAPGDNLCNDTSFDYAVLPPQKTPDNINIPCPFSDTPVPYSVIGKLVKKGGTVFTGSICDTLEKICAENGFSLVNYLEREDFAVKNAVLTAEGVLPVIINNQPCSVFGMEILITGYGRIARVLADYLVKMGACVTVACRRQDSRVWAQICGCKAADITDNEAFCEAVSRASVIINTVPYGIFGEKETASMKSGALYIELASSDAVTGKLPENVKVVTARGIPGNVSPVTAGEIIADTINAVLSEERRSIP